MNFLSAIAGFLIVLALIPSVSVFARKVGLVDHPGGRKQHEDSTPLVGGIVIFPVFMALAFFIGADVQTYGVFFIALIIIVVMGAIDDRVPLPPWVKFFVQVFVSFLVVLFGGARVYHLDDMFGFGGIDLSLMSVPFSVAAVVLLINSINLMDGVDGLAAGKSLVVVGWLIVACVVAGSSEPLVALVPLAGALLGFLFYNMRHPFRDKASVFLGDAGSMGLGLALAWFCITLTQGAEPILKPISIAWIVALPIIDACAQFYRRVREGRHPFSADRGHFHHHLIRAGIPVGRSTAMILLIGFVLGSIGYFGVLFGVPQFILTLAWIGLLFSHMALSLNTDRYTRLFSRLMGRKNP